MIWYPRKLDTTIIFSYFCNDFKFLKISLIKLVAKTSFNFENRFSIREDTPIFFPYVFCYFKVIVLSYYIQFKVI